MTVRTVPGLLAQSARHVPDRTAVRVDDGPGLTFAACHSRSDAVARGLVRRGVQPGDRVALLFDGASFIDFVVSYFGVLKAGAVTVLLADRFTGENLRHLAEHTGVVAVVTDGAAPSGDWWVTTVEELRAGGSGAGAPAGPAPGDTAEIIFTSGTTARPRGVVVTHANLVLSRAAWPAARRPEHRVLHAFPVGSVAAQTVLIDCIGLQQSMVVMSEFSPPRFCALIEAEEVAETYLVPAMGHMLARAATTELRPLTGVRAVKFSSAPLPASALPDLTRVFPRATFYNLYTSTESFPAKLTTRIDVSRLSSIGVPVAASTLRIVGENGAEVVPGETGEIWLRSDRAPARRYLDSAEQGDATFGADGWVRTGDLGYVDGEGFVHLAGRRSDFVNVGGLKVSTFRVEEVLCRHPAVTQAAVVPYSHPVLGEVIAALLVVRAAVTPRELHDHAREHLARHEWPALLRFVDDLARNAAGKVVKRELPAFLGGAAAGEIVLPRTDMERAVAEAWAEVLEQPTLGVLDSFLASGGDSVTVVRLLVALKERIGDDLPADLAEHSTIADMAAALETHRKRSRSIR